MSQWLYDPRGTVDVVVRKLSPRVRTLHGLRLGVLDNTKWNARRLLESTVQVLNESAGFKEVKSYKKETYTRPGATQLMKQIADENDIALIAIGD